MLKKKFIFMSKLIQLLFFCYIKLLVCIFINTLNKLIFMIFNLVVYQNFLKFLMLSRFGYVFEKYEVFNKKLFIL